MICIPSDFDFFRLTINNKSEEIVKQRKLTKYFGFLTTTEERKKKRLPIQQLPYLQSKLIVIIARSLSLTVAMHNLECISNVARVTGRI